MKRLYGAANLPEAYLVLGMLSQAGIRAHVFNENAQGAAGEIPVVHAYPELWLEDEEDYDRARRIIEDYERRAADDAGVTCPACGEPNPQGFEICWHCGEAL
jgi:hypothetical protein